MLARSFMLRRAVVLPNFSVSRPFSSSSLTHCLASCSGLRDHRSRESERANGKTGRADLSSSMEETRLLHRDNNAVVGITGIPKGERNPEIIPLTGSVIRRKRFSDITNLASNGRMARSDVADGQENVKVGPSASSKDYIAHLVKEKNTLMMLLGERNKIIELSAVEMQKLRFLLQNSNQQNQQLARANAQMLAEHNLDKDRLKALHHELECTSAVLKAKNSELEGKNTLIKQLREAIGAENITEEHNKLNTVEEDAPVPASHRKACNPNRKRTLRNQSLGSDIVTHQATAKENDANKRRSLRRRSSNLKSELKEPTEDLFKIDKRKSLRRRSSNLKSELKEPTEDLFEIDDIKIVGVKSPIHLLADDPMHEQSSDRVDSSAPSVSNARANSFEEEHKDQSGSLQDQNRDVQRTSLGRPMRRVAEKISYKEVPLNTKMRRPE